MTSGFAVVTLTWPPINSGGSIAMYSGESFARVSASEMSSAQATTSRPSCWQRGMLFAISSHATLRSLWLISVPAAPASRRVSGGVQPVVGPGPTASTCCANTGTWTSFATCATSVVGGQSTMDAPVSSATAANRLARSQPFLPRTSGWVLKFRTIAGRRMPWPEGAGFGNRLGRERADVSEKRTARDGFCQRQNSTSGRRRNASSPVRNRAPRRRAAVYPIVSAYDSLGRRAFRAIASKSHSSSGSTAMLRNRSKWRLASASPRSRRLARYNSTRFHTLVRSSAARYLLYRGFPRTTSMRAYVSRKKRDALPASTELVLQFLGIDDPVLRRAEGFLDARLVDLQDHFIARLESKFLRDLTRYNDAQGRSPSANTGSRSWHGFT